jgi:hypothetical protein
LPRSGAAGSAVLVTTRDPKALPGASRIAVPPFTEDEAVDYLLRHVNIKSISPSEIERAKEVAHDLGGLPLAITHIAALIKRNDVSISEFARMYINDPRPLYKSGATRPGIGNGFSMDSAFAAAMAGLSPAALALLQTLAFLDPDGVDKNTLFQASPLNRETDSDFQM